MAPVGPETDADAIIARIAAQDSGERTGYADQQAQRAEQVQDGFDSAAGVGFENYDGHSHRSLYDKAQTMTGAPVHGQAQAWTQAAGLADEGFQGLIADIGNAMEGGWGGRRSRSSTRLIELVRPTVGWPVFRGSTDVEQARCGGHWSRPDSRDHAHT